ncbi:hypothetical protein KEM55_004065, partial [Ascosphaera atra]
MQYFKSKLMFSQIVSAARGLFGAKNQNQDQNQDQDQPEEKQGRKTSTNQTSTTTTPRNTTSTETRRGSAKKKTKKDKMVTTRRGTFGPDDATPAASPASQRVTRSKRKSLDAADVSKGASKAAPKRQRTSKAAEEKEGQQSTTSPAEDDNDDAQEPVASGTAKSSRGKKDVKDTKKDSTAKPSSSHMRFGSEEPEAQPEEEQRSSATEGRADGEENGGAGKESDDESSDDEAPEAVGKGAAMEQLKEAARKEAEAKKRAEATKKEKRRERDQQLKTQAATKAAADAAALAASAPDKKQRERDHPPTHDDPDLGSPSSSTLQGSTTTRPAPHKPSLPALLPDDILNAEPEPVLNMSGVLSKFTDDDDDEDSEAEHARQRPTKRRFLDDYDRAQQKALRPKVVRRGGKEI